MGSRIWGRDLWEAHSSWNYQGSGTGEKSNAVATKAPQIPQGGSSGIGRALRSCVKMKQKMRRQSLCTLAFGEGCLWGEGFKIPSARVLGGDSQRAHQQATALAAEGKSPPSWMGNPRAHHDSHYNTVLVQSLMNCFQKQFFSRYFSFSQILLYCIFLYTLTCQSCLLSDIQRVSYRAMNLNRQLLIGPHRQPHYY